MPPLSFGQRLNEGAKKVIAGGIPALFVDAPAPDTYSEAFKQAIPNRMKSVSEQFAMPDVSRDESGKMSVDPESIQRLSDATISMAPVGMVKNVGKYVGKSVSYITKKEAETLARYKSALSESEKSKIIYDHEVEVGKIPTMDKIVIPKKGSGKMPDVLFHGTRKSDAESILKHGFDTSKSSKRSIENPGEVYLSEDKTGINDHSAYMYGDTILNIKKKDGVKLNLLSPDEEYLSLGKARNPEDVKNIIDLLKEKGYDGAIDSSGEYRIWSLDKLKVVPAAAPIALGAGQEDGKGKLKGMIQKTKELFSSSGPEYVRDHSKDGIPRVKSTHKDLYGTVHTLDVPLKVNEKDPTKTTFLAVREPTKRMQETISAVYQKNPEVPRGLLESILMQESSMGATTTNKNKSIGEFAYLVGFTPVAKQELIRNGIIPDLNTPAGVLQAVADYYKLKKDIRDAQGNVVHTYNNMAKWYAERFSSGKLPPEVIQQFNDIYNYYSTKQNKGV